MAQQALRLRLVRKAEQDKLVAKRRAATLARKDAAALLREFVASGGVLLDATVLDKECPRRVDLVPQIRGWKYIIVEELQKGLKEVDQRLSNVSKLSAAELRDLLRTMINTYGGVVEGTTRLPPTPGGEAPLAPVVPAPSGVCPVTPRMPGATPPSAGVTPQAPVVPAPSVSPPTPSVAPPTPGVAPSTPSATAPTLGVTPPTPGGVVADAEPADDLEADPDQPSSETSVAAELASAVRAAILADKRLKMAQAVVLSVQHRSRPVRQAQLAPKRHFDGTAKIPSSTAILPEEAAARLAQAEAEAAEASEEVAVKRARAYSGPSEP